jgi:hypothetical protein
LTQREREIEAHDYCQDDLSTECVDGEHGGGAEKKQSKGGEKAQGEAQLAEMKAIEEAKALEAEKQKLGK